MNAVHDITEALVDEIDRYLAAVDVFRAEACEPTWLPEPAWTSDDENEERAAPDRIHATH